jgi:hypothetical protein
MTNATVLTATAGTRRDRRIFPFAPLLLLALIAWGHRSPSPPPSNR